MKLIVTQSYQSGEINQTELSYLENIFSFDERRLKEIMVPQSKMITLEKEMSIEDIIHVLDKYNYTRYPVIERGQRDQVLGFINTKEMLTSIAAGKENQMEHFIHEMPRFSEKATIKDVLLTMQKNRVHMIVTVNEQGKIVGLVTMEDILEKIVGEIREELPAI